MRYAGWILLGALLAATARGEESTELRVVVSLRTGAQIQGIVRGGLERLENGRFRGAEDEKDPGAGYRIWYMSGTNGFIFIHRRDIVGIEKLGPVTDVERRDLDEKLSRLKVAAEAARSRAREDLVALRERQQGEAEAEKIAAEEAAAAGASREAEELVLKRRSLLERFPPPEWKPERREQIKSNQVILGLAPSPREQEWLDSYELWKPAYDEWLSKQEKPAAEGRSTKPPPEGGGGESR